jgi:GT2 family glycosyltransferase
MSRLGSEVVNRCDVIIVNFDSGGFLKDAVESVLRSPLVSHIYAVDNASTDTSLDSLPRDDRLSIIRNPANLGFAAACNIGVARATSDIVLFLNPDCQVAEGAVEYLIAALQSAERVGMVGPLLLNPDGSEQSGGRRKIPMPRVVLTHMLSTTWLSRYFPALGLPLHLSPLPKQPIEVEAISGACMMVRRAAIEAVGPLDEQYFLHCEDIDWCMRFRQQGWRILFAPDARVIHHKGVSSRHSPLTVEYYKHRGMVLFYGKFLDGSYPRFRMALVVLGIWARFFAVATTQLLHRRSDRI